MANERMNTWGQRVGSPMGACVQASVLGAREGRNTSRSQLDWKQRGRTPLTQILTDGGAEANRLWELKHGTI